MSKNRPTVSQNPPSQNREEYKPVQPPAASPLPDTGNEIKKMLEDLLGGAPEVKIPEEQVPQIKPQPVSIKPQPAKISTHAKKEKALVSHSPSKTQKAGAKSFLTGEKLVTSKKIFIEPELEEESASDSYRDDFDIRQAIIYSEILKRPQY